MRRSESATHRVRAVPSTKPRCETLAMYLQFRSWRVQPSPPLILALQSSLVQVWQAQGKPARLAPGSGQSAAASGSTVVGATDAGCTGPVWMVTVFTGRG